MLLFLYSMSAIKFDKKKHHTYKTVFVDEKNKNK